MKSFTPAICMGLALIGAVIGAVIISATSHPVPQQLWNIIYFLGGGTTGAVVPPTVSLTKGNTTE